LREGSALWSVQTAAEAKKMIKPRLSASVIYWQRRYLITRDGEHCAICGKSQAELRHVLEVEHINGNSNDNRDFNLRLACKSCNQVWRWRLYHERIKTQRPVRSPTSEFIRQVKEKHEQKVAYGKSGYTEGGNSPEPTINQPPIIDLSKMGSEHTTTDKESIDKLRKEPSVSGVSSIVGEGEQRTDAATGLDNDGIEGRYANDAVNVSQESKEMQIAREKEPEYAKWIWEQLMTKDNYGNWKTLTVHDAIYAGAQAVGISPNTTKRYLLKLVSYEGPFEIGEGPRGHQEVRVREGYY
jgi:hypothetical protein